MLNLQGFEQKEGRKEGRFLRVMLRSLTVAVLVVYLRNCLERMWMKMGPLGKEKKAN